MGDVTSSILDLHDSEIARMGDVIGKLNHLQGKAINLEAFRKSVIERFEDIGFKVVVKVYDTNQDGLFAFDIDIVERLEGTFDPDRQVHEVTHDYLGLGESGVIKTEENASGLHVVGGHHGHGGKNGHRH